LNSWSRYKCLCQQPNPLTLILDQQVDQENHIMPLLQEVITSRSASHWQAIQSILLLCCESYSYAHLQPFSLVSHSTIAFKMFLAVDSTESISPYHSYSFGYNFQCIIRSRKQQQYPTSFRVNTVSFIQVIKRSINFSTWILLWVWH